jgi:hypothetical protein
MIESKLSALREKTTLTKLARASELSRQQVHRAYSLQMLVDSLV